MFIENIGPQMHPDCTRLTGADHTVSTSTGREYGAGLKACEAGDSDAVPMACNARICNLAAPFHQCLTHGLPGLQLSRKKRSLAYLLNGLLGARGTKRRECKEPGGIPRLGSDAMTLKGTASAKVFAASVLLFSEKHRRRRTVNATRHRKVGLGGHASSRRHLSRQPGLSRLQLRSGPASFP